jgi:FkbM family methyltransferase
LDVGGYDGYTSEEFIKKCPNYKKIYIFEPENDNLVKAKERLAKFKNINYYELGLSNKKETLKFDISGSASKISDEGRVIIKVDKLDDLNINEFTFLKMDIEGAEEVALEGAKESIKKNHPKLAISVYHKANDFWKIPELIFNIRDDYKIYLRHYTESIYETVMFFIPIKKGF